MYIYIYIPAIEFFSPYKQPFLFKLCFPHGTIHDSYPCDTVYFWKLFLLLSVSPIATASSLSIVMAAIMMMTTMMIELFKAFSTAQAIVQWE